MEKNQTLNETLKKYLQDAHVDLFSSDDEVFERVKPQALCIICDLDVSKMDFFKIVVDDQLINMEEASLKAEVLKDAMTNNPTPEAQDDEHHDVWVCLSLLFAINDDVPFVIF